LAASTIWGRTARTTANAGARLFDMGTSFIRTPLVGDAQEDPRGDPAGCAAGVLVRPNLMTRNAAVHCTQVDPDAIMVRCAAPWFSWTGSGCLETAAALPQERVRPVFGSVRRNFTRRTSIESTCGCPEQHAWRPCRARAQGAFGACNSERHISLKARKRARWLRIQLRRQLDERLVHLLSPKLVLRESSGAILAVLRKPG
jgi:hypothetical protein